MSYELMSIDIYKFMVLKLIKNWNPRYFIYDEFRIKIDKRIKSFCKKKNSTGIHPNWRGRTTTEIFKKLGYVKSNLEHKSITKTRKGGSSFMWYKS